MDRPHREATADSEIEINPAILEIGGPDDDWDAYVNACAAADVGRELDPSIEMSPDDPIVWSPDAEAEAWQTDAYTSGPEAELEPW